MEPEISKPQRKEHFKLVLLEPREELARKNTQKFNIRISGTIYSGLLYSALVGRVR